MLHDVESRLLIARERAELLRADAAGAPRRPRRRRTWNRQPFARRLHLRPGYASAVSVSGSKK